MKEVGKNNLGWQGGFTLIEMLFFIALFVIIFLAFFSLYSEYGVLFTEQQGVVSIAGSARAIVSEVQSAVLQADQVVASHTIATTTYSLGTTTLVLELPAIDASGDIVTGAYDYAVLYVSGPNVYRRLEANPGSSRVSGLVQLSDTISTLAFTYNSSTSSVSKVDTDVVTRVQVKGQTIQYHLHQQAYLRNL